MTSRLEDDFGLERVLKHYDVQPGDYTPRQLRPSTARPNTASPQRLRSASPKQRPPIFVPVSRAAGPLGWFEQKSTETLADDNLKLRRELTDAKRQLALANTAQRRAEAEAIRLRNSLIRAGEMITGKPHHTGLSPNTYASSLYRSRGTTSLVASLKAKLEQTEGEREELRRRVEELAKSTRATLIAEREAEAAAAMSEVRRQSVWRELLQRRLAEAEAEAAGLRRQAEGLAQALEAQKEVQRQMATLMRAPGGGDAESQQHGGGSTGGAGGDDYEDDWNEGDADEAGAGGVGGQQRPASAYGPGQQERAESEAAADPFTALSASRQHVLLAALAAASEVLVSNARKIDSRVPLGPAYRGNMASLDAWVGRRGSDVAAVPPAIRILRAHQARLSAALKQLPGGPISTASHTTTTSASAPSALAPPPQPRSSYTGTAPSSSPPRSARPPPSTPSAAGSAVPGVGGSAARSTAGRSDRSHAQASPRSAASARRQGPATTATAGAPSPGSKAATAGAGSKPGPKPAPALDRAAEALAEPSLTRLPQQQRSVASSRAARSERSARAVVDAGGDGGEASEAVWEEASGARSAVAGSDSDAEGAAAVDEPVSDAASSDGEGAPGEEDEERRAGSGPGSDVDQPARSKHSSSRPASAAGAGSRSESSLGLGSDEEVEAGEAGDVPAPLREPEEPPPPRPRVPRPQSARRRTPAYRTSGGSLDKSGSLNSPRARSTLGGGEEEGGAGGQGAGTGEEGVEQQPKASAGDEEKEGQAGEEEDAYDDDDFVKDVEEGLDGRGSFSDLVDDD
ncbi:hypothetical protein HYH03_010230 [Edaphochlamys debaryana]|uniref:Uncharacterized protein n=1 Tax=Edaphochlamys debaryana TaxID=47281 RepID=A0A835XX56_9CHLO|nr:hypothetical protein HYH03_010230 [Edaphochlamys debaryana]|eukprot:KAG2491444.1 hypothetical protein HYH03_010230 [Edaphochlamys debaryana]